MHVLQRWILSKLVWCEYVCMQLFISLLKYLLIRPSSLESCFCVDIHAVFNHPHGATSLENVCISDLGHDCKWIRSFLKSTLKPEAETIKSVLYLFYALRGQISCLYTIC